MSVKKYDIAKEWKRGVAVAIRCEPIRDCDNESKHFIAGWRWGRSGVATNAMNKYLKSVGEEPMAIVKAMRLTEKQKKMADKHGTLSQFMSAVLNARDNLMITAREAKVAITKYDAEWKEAGKD